ncbi:WASH complex subunit 3 [Vanessa tameamea]|uniref:WASH complex subunit 3 n=1 Tax=Vanessa tameamea TaxID=334116 RepID=A0A8B8HS70_VANTA|nr:WASH complex subunit 3 [Vanessa tameamea]
MQDTIINQEIANLDLSKIAALQQKRTLAFVNHFVITTVQFLNNFAKRCEQKLMLFERKLEKINATMVLLEARLSSIPEVAQIATEIDNLKPKESIVQTPNEINETVTNNDDDNKPENKNATETIKPEYERFIKMVQVGVPIDAVKLKISLEGLDPNELDKIMKK